MNINSCGHNEQGSVIVKGHGVLCGSCAFRAVARREAAKASYTAFRQLHDWVEEQDLFGGEK